LPNGKKVRCHDQIQYKDVKVYVRNVAGYNVICPNPACYIFDQQTNTYVAFFIPSEVMKNTPSDYDMVSISCKCLKAQQSSQPGSGNSSSTSSSSSDINIEVSMCKDCTTCSPRMPDPNGKPVQSTIKCGQTLAEWCKEQGYSQDECNKVRQVLKNYKDSVDPSLKVIDVDYCAQPPPRPA
jgi:hypothetical protein